MFHKAKAILAELLQLKLKLVNLKEEKVIFKKYSITSRKRIRENSIFFIAD